MERRTCKSKTATINNNYSYVQGGTVLVTRIDFPTIRNLLLDDRHFKIIKAELVIQPSVIMNPDYLPDNLLLIVTNKHSDLLSKYTDGEGNDVKSTLNIDYMDRENSSYTWDITSFIEEITQVEESNYNGLLILPENYDSDFDHVIISDQKRSHFKTFLKLYVMYYE